MSLFSLFSAVVMAAELIISPIPDSVLSPVTTYPAKTFGQLTTVILKPLAVLGATDQRADEAPLPAPTPLPFRTTKKSHYTIAFLGDSMIDTLGPDIPHTRDALKKIYPKTTFKLLNFGVGATNIDYGLERIEHNYTYLGNSVQSVASANPDIVVVESFGYNPYSYDTGAIDRHWLQLAAIVDSLRKHIPGVQIVIASTIAPNSKTFGDGAAGLAFSMQDKSERTTVIKNYLSSTVKFAKSQKLPLADVYHASLDSRGDGRLVYINGGDNIHYSDEGRKLFAKKLSETILDSRLLEK